MACRYQEVNTGNEDHNLKEKESTKSLLKQLLICSTVWTQFFMAGLCMGGPPVFIPQLRREGLEIDDDMASWVYTTASLSGLPWLIVVPIVTKHIGRKIPELLTTITMTISFTILYFSQHFYQIIISELFQGILHAANMSVTILVVTEYSSPRYRGIFLTIKSASFFWGIWVANAIGTYYYWKNIAILGIACSLFTYNIFLWPESPVWLASRGRLEECQKSFRWVHGVNRESERYLRELCLSQDESIKLEKDGYEVGFFDMFKLPEFYKPLILSIMTVIQCHFSGKIICTLYVLDIFKQITEDEGSAYTAMLILDGVTVFAMYFGSFISKIIKRRVLYLSTSFVGVAFLFIISFYLFLIRLAVVNENKYLMIALLTLFSIAISCGPLILSMSVFGELVPIKFQASSYIIIALTFGIVFTLLLKLLPMILATFNVDGTFLFFALTCGSCTLYLYFYLPETKNKTQLEIEMFFKDNKKDNEALKLNQTDRRLVISI